MYKQNIKHNKEWEKDAKYPVYNDEALALVTMWKNSSGKQRGLVENQILNRLSYLIYKRIRGYKKCDYYEDLLQEGRIGLITAVDKFDSTRGLNFFKFGIWCIQSRITAFLAWRKKCGNESPTGLTCDCETAAPDPGTHYEYQEGNKVLMSAIGSLPEMDKQIVLMRFGIDGSGGRSYKQIGDVFSLSKQRIEQITSRAISNLRKNKQIKTYFCEL